MISARIGFNLALKYSMVKNKSKILITGAAGFIGSHLTEALILKGYKVIGIDDLSKGSEKNLQSVINHKNFLFIKKDIAKLSKAFLRMNSKDLFSNLDVIVHLAAAKIPRYGNRLETLMTNIKGTQTILEIAKLRKSKVVFASTSDVYGKNSNFPFTEDLDLVLGPTDVARWAYSTSKIFDEHLCFAYWEKYNVPFVILRLFGIYGPHQHRSWWGGPQSLFIDAILSGKPIEVHGTGKQSRTFLYIDDAIDAFLKTLESKRAEGEIINVGSKEEISINSLARLLSKLIKKTLKIKRIDYKDFTGAKYEDISRKVPDIRKAKKILNWQPETNLRIGMAKTIEWYKENPL